jgi:hypothetical protein
MNYTQNFPQLQTIVGLKQDLAAKQARWTSDAQKLSIGIMGQVKAGKSSFLNALLFDGKPILPTAATPKTANLTKISYGEQFSLTIEYYSQTEWQQIQNTANINSEATDVKVAQELVGMVQNLAAIEVNRCLTQAKEVITVADLDGLQGLLNQYTGNNGTHTALVKSTEITLPIAELKGYELVDTPGMNDPVVSRTQKTRGYMANCDVVFFLSRASEFLDSSDSQLLINQLPSKGIKRLVVVAGQFDSAILDDGYDRDSLEATLQNLYKRLGRHAQNKAQEIADKKGGLNDQQTQMMVDSLSNPVFTSTFAHGFITWDKADWNESMVHVYDQLTELAEDEWDDEFSKQDWQKIANFETLVQAYEQAKRDRQALLGAQKASYLPDAYQQMIAEYQSLEQSIQQRIEFIQTKDVADIEQVQKQSSNKAKSIASTLAYTLTEAKNTAKQSSVELISQLKQDQHQFSQLATRKGSREEEYSYTVSTSRWYNPFSWGSSRTAYSTRTVSYDFLNPHDVIEQVNQFASEANAQIVREFGKLIAPAQLKLKLKQALIHELNTSSENFDPMLFRSMLENFIAKLDLPVFHVELGDTTALIANNFSGEVTSSSQMNELRQQLNQSLSQVLQRMQQAFETQLNLVLGQLERARQGLTEELTADLQAELERMKQQIANKEDEIKGYQELLAETGQERKQIMQQLVQLNLSPK